jgi:hypothetical protein
MTARRTATRSAEVEHFDIPAKPARVLSFEEEERLMPKAAAGASLI